MDTTPITPEFDDDSTLCTLLTPDEIRAKFGDKQVDPVWEEIIAWHGHMHSEYADEIVTVPRSDTDDRSKRYVVPPALVQPHVSPCVFCGADVHHSFLLPEGYSSYCGCDWMEPDYMKSGPAKKEE